MFAVPSFFGYNTTFVSTPVATAATGVGETSFTANWNAFVGASYYLLDVSTSSSFSSFVGSYQNFVVLTNSQVVSGLTANTTYYYRLRAATGVDADAAAFFGRVYTAGGSLSYTEVSATETLVASLKANSLWTPMKAIYPMVGASMAACSQNLKSSSFTGTFTSGWTFASTGVTPNGTSAYMDTNLIPSSNMSNSSASMGFANNIPNTNGSGVEIGVQSAIEGMTIWSNAFSSSNSRIGRGADASSSAYTNAGRLYGSRTTATLQTLYRDGVSVATGVGAVTALETVYNITLGGLNLSGTPNLFANGRYTFAFIGDGLSGTNITNLDSAIVTFNTSLSR